MIKKQSMLLALIFIFTVIGCSNLYQPNKITGQWKFKDPAQGPLLLTFTHPDRFELDSNGDGEKDIWGTFEVVDDRVKLLDDEPRIITDCYEPGIHKFEIEGKELRFTAIAEQCKPRKSILKYPMFRQK